MLPGIQGGCKKGFAHQPEGLWFMFPTWIRRTGMKSVLPRAGIRLDHSETLH